MVVQCQQTKIPWLIEWIRILQYHSSHNKLAKLSTLGGSNNPTTLLVNKIWAQWLEIWAPDQNLFDPLDKSFYLLTKCCENLRKFSWGGKDCCQKSRLARLSFFSVQSCKVLQAAHQLILIFTAPLHKKQGWVKISALLHKKHGWMKIWEKLVKLGGAVANYLVQLWTLFLTNRLLFCKNKTWPG